MMEIFSRCGICAFQTRVAGSAGNIQSATTLRNAEMYIVTVANVVALQLPSVGGMGLYLVHCNSIGSQVRIANTSYIRLNTVITAKMTRMVICRQRLRGQIRRRNIPTIHLVNMERITYMKVVIHL